jgi:hypothetical protein
VINPDAESFTVTVMPNPSTSDFTLHITGKSAEPVQIRIVDITGKQISVTKLNGNVTAARLGADLGSGTYFAEVTRGNSRQVVKLVRLK